MRFNLVVSVLFATALTLGAVLAQATVMPENGFNSNGAYASSLPKALQP